MSNPHEQQTAEAWLRERLLEQQEAHSGRALRAWAEEVLQVLPSGPLQLFSTSTEGCALAAVIAALRHDETEWQRVDLYRPVRPRDGFAGAVVEAVEVGSGLREAINKAMPGTMLVVGVAASRQSLAA